MSIRYGIDVSSYQGVIDWQKVKKAGCARAVLKITRKDLSLDSQFKNNLLGCKKQGISYDVYRYVYENTADQAEKAAAAVVKWLGSCGADRGTCIWWDVEDSTIRPNGRGEKTRLTDSILAAQRVAEEAGYSFGVYCGWYWYQSVLDHKRLTCPFWIARYPHVKQLDFGAAPEAKYRPETSQPLWGWQYSSRGRIDGISGAVDLNEVYLEEEQRSECQTGREDHVRTFQKWLAEKGETDLTVDGDFGPKSKKAAVRVLQRTLNSGRKQKLSPDGIWGPKTKAAVITLRKGDEGDLVRLLQGLLYANGQDPKGFDGSFGCDTQAAVKAFQNARGLTVDGLAGKNTFERLVK